jgi:hypothetical protein
MYRNMFRGANSNNVGKKRFSGLEVTRSLHIAKRGRLAVCSKACPLFANDDLSEKRGIPTKSCRTRYAASNWYPYCNAEVRGQGQSI